MFADEIKIIEGAQTTDDWHQLREGNITGSVAKQVKTSGDAFLYETLAFMTTKRKRKDLKGVKDVERGNELEPEARKAYMKETGAEVVEVSYIDRGRIGISPDGIIYKPARNLYIEKLIEIKCPDTNNHIRYILTDKVPKEHIDQIIHGFVVCEGVDEIDFVSYCPAFRFKPLHIITVRRMDLVVDISAAAIKYEKFIHKLDASYQKLIT